MGEGVLGDCCICTRYYEALWDGVCLSVCLCVCVYVMKSIDCRLIGRFFHLCDET